MKLHSAAKVLVSATLLPVLVLPLGAQTARKNAPTDSQILGQVQKIFQDEHAFVGSSILPSVNYGVVTLTGNVRSEAEKTLASSELANIDGVKTVLNNLSIVDHTFHPPAAPAGAPGPTGPKVVTLPQGSAIPIRLTDELDTKAAKAGDTFHATTATNITSGGYTLARAGTPVTGRIVEAKAAGRLSGSAELTIELVSMKLFSPNSQDPEEVAVLSEQLSSKGAGRGANTAAKTGGGAAFGAIIGGLAGGGTGAGIGAASGGALGLGANIFTHGKEIDLKPEQLLQFRTAAPLDVTISLVNGHQVLPPASNGPALQSPLAGASPQAPSVPNNP
jgi:hypothetical protein